MLIMEHDLMSLVFSGAGLNVLRTYSGRIAITSGKGEGNDRESNRMNVGKTLEAPEDGRERQRTEIDMTFHLLLLVPNVPSLRNLYARYENLVLITGH